MCVKVLGGKKLTAFTSDQSHCSIERGCMLLGLGRNACVTVPTNQACQMDVNALEVSILEVFFSCSTPFMFHRAMF